MFGGIFRPYGLVWRMLNTVTDVLGLTLCFFLCCLPVVTVGPALTALYDSVVHGIRYDEGGAYRRFFRTFKAEWKLGCLQTLLWGIVTLFLAWIAYVVRVLGGESMAVVASAYRAVVVLPVTVWVWSCIIQSRFAFSCSALNSTALRFFIGYLPATFLMLVCGGVVVWFTLSYALSAFFTPACLVLLWSFPAEWVFRKHGGGIQSALDD